MTEHETLVNRVHVVATSLGLDPMFSEVALRVSDASPTAVWVYNETRTCCEVHCHPRLVAELPDGELRVLLLHELCHHLAYSTLWHLRNVASWKAVNMALDIALEHPLYGSPYGKDLLALNNRLFIEPLPPYGLFDQSTSLDLLMHPSPPLDRMRHEHAVVSRRLWAPGRSSPTPEEVYAAIIRFFPPDGGDAERSPEPVVVSGEILRPRYIPDGGDALDVPEDVRGPIVRVIRFLRGDGPGHGSRLSPIHVKACTAPRPRIERFRAWLLSLRSREKHAPISAEDAASGARDIQPRSVLVRPTAQALVRAALGLSNLYHQNRVQRIEQRRPLSVFIDVSSSMAWARGHVVTVIRSAQDLFPVQLWAFDTKVVQLDRSAAVNGALFSGGGTSFDAVFSRAIDEGLRDILVLTDGESSVSASIEKAARNAGVCARAVLFRGGGATRSSWWDATFMWERT